MCAQAINLTVVDMKNQVITESKKMCIRDRGYTSLQALKQGDIPFIMGFNIFLAVLTPVSYTHLDVYKRQVSVFKLIARHTIEENILKLQEAKRKLAEQVLGGESVNLGSLSREELIEMLS